MPHGLECSPGLPAGWAMHHYDDEVAWWQDDLGYPVDYWVCQYPFVPGFFVAITLDDECDDKYSITSCPIAGPFKTLLEAIATIKLIRP